MRTIKFTVSELRTIARIIRNSLEQGTAPDTLLADVALHRIDHAICNAPENRRITDKVLFTEALPNG